MNIGDRYWSKYSFGTQHLNTKSFGTPCTTIQPFGIQHSNIKSFGNK